MSLFLLTKKIKFSRGEWDAVTRVKEELREKYEVQLNFMGVPNAKPIF